MKQTNVDGGIGFVGLLQIAFIVLKLCGVIAWSWWVVFLPTLISIGVFAIIMIIIFINTWRFKKW